jgi:hypothetical protein
MSQQQQQQQYNKLLQNKHSIGNHLRVTSPKFDWDLPCSYGLRLDVLQEPENGQTDPDDTGSFRMISVSCLESS